MIFWRSVTLRDNGRSTLLDFEAKLEIVELWEDGDAFPVILFDSTGVEPIVSQETVGVELADPPRRWRSFRQWLESR